MLPNRFYPFKSENQYGAKYVTQPDIHEVGKLANKFGGELTKVRPYKKSAGVKHAEGLIKVFHDPTVTRNWIRDLIRSKHTGSEYSFEMWFSEGKLRFIFKTPNQGEKQEIHKEINGYYPDAKLYDSNRFMPKIPKGSYLAGGELSLKKDKYAPLRSFSGPDPFEKESVEGQGREEAGLIDPYESVISALLGHQQQAVLFQVTFRPAPFNWTDGYGPIDPSAERISEYLMEGRVVDSLIDPRIMDPTEKDKRTAEHISDLEESQAFECNIRYFASATDQRKVTRKAEAIENAVTTQYQNSVVAQQLEARRFAADEILAEYKQAANREVEYNGTILTKSELAALAHLPNETINKSNVDFVKTVVGNKAPGSADTTQKQNIKDKADDREQDRYEEAKQAPDPVTKAETTAEPGTSIIEKAREIINTTDDSYYRDSVDAEDYPDTEVTEDMSPEIKDRFLKFCAAYEQGNLLKDKFEEKVGSEERAQEFYDKFERHIELAYIQRAKKHQAQTQPQASSTDQTTHQADQQTASTETAHADADNTLPATHEQVNENSDSQEHSNNNTATNSQGDKRFLPDTQGKHPINVVDVEHKQTRTGSGDLLTISYAEFAKTAKDDDPKMYMGEDVKKLLIEKHETNSDNDLWVGYQESGDNPFREVGIPKESWFKHISLFGGTGLGKSTEIKNLVNQVIRKGYGCVVIDPKGDMVQELMYEIPDDRLDDIIWIEPGSIEHDRIAAINFLQASVDKDHPRYDREVESIVSDLQAVLRAGEYWGPKMAGITKNITRAMVRSENPYTLYDMYNVLIDQEKRWNFARSLQREDVDLGESGSGELSEDIKQYSRRIAQMDEEEVDPVVRRLQDWAESPISKEIVSHRYSSVNIDEAVNNDKIILLKNSVEDREIKRVISTAIMRRVWVAIQARAETTKEEDRTPFWAFIDEFDDVVSDDMEIDKMLSKARSGKMSVTLACQNPSQIEEKHPNILKQIFANTSTMLSFAVTEPQDGHLIAERMGEEFTKTDLMNLEQYKVVSRISHIGEYGPEISDPMGIYTVPDYPPLRTEQQAKAAIERSLDQYGVEPMENHPGETDLLISGGGLQEQVVANFLELVWNEHHRKRTNTVHVESIADRFEEKTGEALEDYPKGLGIPKDMIEVHNVSFAEEDETDDAFGTDTGFDGGDKLATDGDGGAISNSTTQSDKIAFETDSRIYIQKPQAEVSITGKGIEAVLKQDSGRSQPTPNHREIIKEMFRWFSRLGFYTLVPVQTGENEVCDARANLPISRDLSINEIKAAIEQFTEQNELAAEISDTADLNIEAEGTTHQKPARTIENVLRAYKDGRRCLLVVKDGREEGKSKTYHANLIENILTDPPYYREDRNYPPGVDPTELDDPEPVRHLYNKASKISVGSPGDDQEKFALIPKGSQTVWIDTGDKLILYDGITPDADYQGEIEYTETTHASSNAMEIWCRYDEYQEEWVVYPGQNRQYRYDTKEELKEEYQFVYQPLLMQTEVDMLPKRDDWEIIILPDTDAINRDPQSPAEQTANAEQASEESYELDIYFPKEEVPLIYKNGTTEPLIPAEKEEMFTPSRQKDNTRDTTPDNDTLEDRPTLEEIMNSFEQIACEIETRKEIEGYKKEHSQQYYERQDELEEIYGAKNPGKIDLWRSVWAEYEYAHDDPIPKPYLPDAIMGAVGLTRNEAEQAIDIGREFGYLREVVDAVDIDLDYAQDDNPTLYRLVLPSERPDLYVDDAERFADRDMWAGVWESLEMETNEPLATGIVENVFERLYDISDDEIKAAIEVGEMAECISHNNGEIRITSERPREYWMDIWESSGVNMQESLTRKEINIGIASIEGIGISEAETIAKKAINRGEIYSPDDLPDDEYIINDPATDDGPKIETGEEGGVMMTTMIQMLPQKHHLTTSHQAARSHHPNPEMGQPISNRSPHPTNPTQTDHKRQQMQAHPINNRLPDRQQIARQQAQATANAQTAIVTPL